MKQQIIVSGTGGQGVLFLTRVLAQAGLEMGAAEILGFMSLAAFLAGATAYAAGWHDLRVLAPALVAGALPIVWLFHRRARRLEQFGAQLPDALELMAGSLRAGHAYSSAIRLVG